MTDEANPKDIIGATKAPLRLVPPALVIETAKAMALGAAKYGAYNWRDKAVRLSIYLEAAQRHILAYQDGEDLDPESGATHLAHAAACIGIVLDAAGIGKLIDDRPVPGPAAAFLAAQAGSRTELPEGATASTPEPHPNYKCRESACVCRKLVWFPSISSPVVLASLGEARAAGRKALVTARTYAQKAREEARATPPTAFQEAVMTDFQRETAELSCDCDEKGRTGSARCHVARVKDGWLAANPGSEWFTGDFPPKVPANYRGSLDPDEHLQVFEEVGYIAARLPVEREETS